MDRNTFCIHVGGEVVDFDTVRRVPTPPPTKTHYPISHATYVEHVRAVLEDTNFVIGAEQHALSHNGERYFGMFHLDNPPGSTREFSWAVGLRNSHDMHISARLAAGTRVFVCDNLCFSGEIMLARKHTKNAQADLKNLTVKAIGDLNDLLGYEDYRFEAYKTFTVADKDVHDIVIRAVDCKAITPSRIPYVLQQWREPAHEEFQPRNVWSLFNAVTEDYKAANRNVGIAINRGRALRGLLDGVAGVQPFETRDVVEAELVA